MKQFFKTKDQWLLERYPLIWNTKIVWTLSACLFLHLIFYACGVLSMIDPEVFQQYNAKDLYFSSGLVFFGLIVSILLILIWLIMMFRNNAFKNFYPISRNNLFLQFLIYFITVLAASSFYYSYALGMQTYVSLEYSDERMENDIAAINLGMPLVPLDLDDYELDRLRLPFPFDTLYCETHKMRIDQNYSFFRFKKHYYQYWDYYLFERPFSQGEFNFYQNDSVIFTETDYDREVFIHSIKKKVVNVDLPHGTQKPSFFNFSEVFYSDGSESDYYHDDYSYSMEYDYDRKFLKLSPDRRQVIENNQKLLKQGSKNIKAVLKNLEKLAETYQIKNNLKVDEWLKTQLYQEPYLITELIKNGEKPYNADSRLDPDTSPFGIYERSLYQNRYFDASSWKKSLSNIHDIKTTNIFEASIHVFIWISFLLSVIIFAFRVAGLRPLLFSIVAIGVLAVLIFLLVAVLFLIFEESAAVGFSIPISIGAGIYFIAMFRYRSIKKIVSGVFLIVAMAGIVPLILTIIGGISVIQESSCPKAPNNNNDHCFILLEDIGFYWSYILLVAGFAFIYYQCRIWMNWRALPEG